MGPFEVIQVQEELKASISYVIELAYPLDTQCEGFHVLEKAGLVSKSSKPSERVAFNAVLYPEQLHLLRKS